jgi:hypothetical protein
MNSPYTQSCDAGQNSHLPSAGASIRISSKDWSEEVLAAYLSLALPGWY